MFFVLFFLQCVRKQPVIIVTTKGKGPRNLTGWEARRFFCNLLTNPFFACLFVCSERLHSNVVRAAAGASLLWPRFQSMTDAVCHRKKGSSRYFIWWRKTGLSWRCTITLRPLRQTWESMCLITNSQSVYARTPRHTLSLLESNVFIALSVLAWTEFSPDRLLLVSQRQRGNVSSHGMHY